MGYHFDGIFADGDITVDAMSRLFPSEAKEISEPFRGVGVSLKGRPGDFDLDAALRRASSEHPDSTFVRVVYETFGGLADHCAGSAYRRGAQVPGSETSEEEDDASIEALIKLIKYLGVTLNSDGYFAPFERGYFPDT
jgi:hypothetical protein